MSNSAPLSSFRVRPRFVHTVTTSRDETHAMILSALAREPDAFEVKPFPEFIGIHIAEKDRKQWSPRLFLSLDPLPEGGTRISGTYGPEIEVWGIFLYAYLLTGLLGTFSAIYGCAQLVIEAKPWAFWVTGAMAAIALIFYLAAQLGQKLGAWQTFQLHQAYQNAVSSPTVID